MKTIFITIAFSFLLASCSESGNTEVKYHPGGPYYYKSWATYHYPYRPTYEITLEETKQLVKNGNAYYKGYFNNDGKIQSFEKIYLGKTVWKEEYTYENSNKIKVTTYIENKKEVKIIED